MKESLVLNDDLILEAESPSSFSGAYEVVIKEAIYGRYASGASYVQLRIAIPSRKNDEGEPKEYQTERHILTSGNEKGNAPVFFMGKFQAAFRLLGLKNMEVAPAPARVWDADKNDFVEKDVDQFVGLLGKKIGAVISMTAEYPVAYIDGYTKEMIPKSQHKEYAYAVAIPQYKNEQGQENRTYNRYSIIRFYSLDSANYGKTFSEITNGKPAKDVEYQVKKIQDNRNDPEIMDDNAMDVYIKAQLKRILDKMGEEFDPDRFVPYKNAVTADDFEF